jgi:hypothetical protein
LEKASVHQIGEFDIQQRRFTDEEQLQSRKLFYENELANPRPIYTDLQKRYVQEELDKLNRALEREQNR